MRKRKRKSKRTRSPSRLPLLLILLALIPIISIFKLKPHIGAQKLATFDKSIVIPRLTPTSTPTPTPTLIPTPTPVPLVGYCLYTPVLLYHHVQPQSVAKEKGQTSLSVDNGAFDLQMGYLASNGYTTITAKALVDALKNHTTLPQKSIVVTLDDGYKDNYDYAYPILQKYHINATLMIPTGLLGGSEYINWNQLHEMVNSGLVTIGNHTWSHYSVNYGLSDKVHYEIETAKQQLQDNLGQNIDIFTYPYGGFNDLSISILRQDGFSGAFSTIPGFWQCDSFVMALHRNRIGNSSLSYYGL